MCENNKSMGESIYMCVYVYVYIVLNLFYLLGLLCNVSGISSHIESVGVICWPMLLTICSSTVIM